VQAFRPAAVSHAIAGSPGRLRFASEVGPPLENCRHYGGVRLWPDDCL